MSLFLLVASLFLSALGQLIGQLHLNESDPVYNPVYVCFSPKCPSPSNKTNIAVIFQWTSDIPGAVGVSVKLSKVDVDVAFQSVLQSIHLYQTRLNFHQLSDIYVVFDSTGSEHALDRLCFSISFGFWYCDNSRYRAEKNKVVWFSPDEETESECVMDTYWLGTVWEFVTDKWLESRDDDWRRLANVASLLTLLDTLWCIAEYVVITFVTCADVDLRHRQAKLRLRCSIQPCVSSC